MENPHDERQTVLLERINKTTMKTTELVAEVNACLGGLYRAHESLRAVASLTDKYRKNVHYNLQSAAVRKETGQAPAGEQ